MSTTQRSVTSLFTAIPTMEGAGVHLHRVFGNREVPHFDPFLLLDDFSSDTPSHYLKGFPWHPHRGIETITYVLAGEVDHGDSLGNKGTIRAGDVQWMTAGSGIIHQEMPRGDDLGRMHGFQLWANLPASHKMMGPRYREVLSGTIPTVELPGGATARIIAGSLQGTQGPVTDVVTTPRYLDLTFPPKASITLPVETTHTCFAYIFEGSFEFMGERPLEVSRRTLAAFSHGDEVVLKSTALGGRLLLVSGSPIGEPVAWYGPVVMNTNEELELAFEEYRAGTFIK